MNPVTEAARAAARQKLAALFPGQTGINFADEVADSILAAGLAAARIRVAALPTANQGRLIAATRNQILAAFDITKVNPDMEAGA